jgi:hypothetical protein
LGELAKALTPTRLMIVLDEWSTIPLELQPYLADLIRRAVFPVPGITVKIAAIEQRSNFKIGSHADYAGIEVGADASADVDLDDYMVFDNNAERAVDFFQELLFKHYSSEAGPRPEFHTSNDLIQAAFTQRNAFEDFVRAAEGACHAMPLMCYQLRRNGALSIRSRYPLFASPHGLGSSAIKKELYDRIPKPRSSSTGLSMRLLPTGAQGRFYFDLTLATL